MSKILERILIGNILTLSNATPVVEAVGIKDGVIVALGASEDIKKLSGQNTDTIDLTGKTVLPGFIDTHVHAGFTGTSAMSVNLDDAVSIQDVLERLNARIAKTPDGELVYATRFNYTTVAEHRMPTMTELDGLSTKHPIAIHCMDGHSVMLNALFFQDLNLAPEEEGVARDQHGNPTGLVEDPAITKIFFLFAPQEKSKLMPLLLNASNEALRAGVTTIHIKETPASMEIVLENEKYLPIRVKPFYLFTSEDFGELDDLLNSGRCPGKWLNG